MGKSSYIFNNVYLQNWSSVVGKKEYLGPLGPMADQHFDDLYFNNQSYEKAEISLVKTAINYSLKKSNLKEEQIDLLIGGDLINQIVVSNYAAMKYNIPFVGVYGACSTTTLAFLTAAMFLENNYRSDNKNIITFVSSHNGSAERTFRYPNEYGTQRCECYTTTVTAANSFLFSNQKSKIKLTKATVGKVIDSTMRDCQDMGRAMAPAAYQTILEHFNDFECDIDEYDLILTGDLSYYGNLMLQEMFLEDGIEFTMMKDSGLMVYDRKKQNVWAGGSGAGCIGIALACDVFPKMECGVYKKVLVCATGALMNSTMLAQSETIPGICHAITFEVIE